MEIMTPHGTVIFQTIQYVGISSIGFISLNSIIYVVINIMLCIGGVHYVSWMSSKILIITYIIVVVYKLYCDKP